MARQAYNDKEIDQSMMDETSILDAEVRNSFKVKKIGRGSRQSIMRPSPGGFCIAYPLYGANDTCICYRVWKVIIPDALQRYKFIGKGISETRLPYFSNFRFIEQALRVKTDGQIVAGMIMDWINGETLDKFLAGRWQTLTAVQKVTFIRDFYLMCDNLRRAGIAHGDLSSQNIMVNNNREIRLVDYDSVYVAAMGTNFYQTTGGAAAFQHPDRTENKDFLKASINDDNFSQLVIALSLWLAYFEPQVIGSYDDSNLLFIKTDFSGNSATERLKSLKNSKGWNIAQKYASSFAHISTLLSALETALSGPLHKVPSLLDYVSRQVIVKENFYTILSGGKILNPVIYVDYCTACGKKFNNSDFQYCPACGRKRHQISA